MGIHQTLIMSMILVLSVKLAQGEKCHCGVFKDPTEEKTTATPEFSDTVEFNFECNPEGKENCSKMCKTLAGASKEKGPKKICELIHDSTTPYVPLVYYKACEDSFWHFSGLKSTLSVCCKNKEAVPCP